jgi:uncharacterized membrane protein
MPRNPVHGRVRNKTHDIYIYINTQIPAICINICTGREQRDKNKLQYSTAAIHNACAMQTRGNSHSHRQASASLCAEPIQTYLRHDNIRKILVGLYLHIASGTRKLKTSSRSLLEHQK